MARVIAIVTELSGKFFAKDAKGNSVELQKGDEIFEGMTVYGDSANGASDTIHIHAYSGEEIMLASNQEQLFDVTMVDAELADLDAVIAEESIAAIIAENTPQKTQEEEEEDIFEEETAAGDEKAKKDADVAGDFAARDGNMADVNSDLRDARFKVQSSVFEIKSRFEREDDNGFETLRGDETGTFGLVSRPESVVSVPLATFETTENEKFVANESRIPSVEVQPEPTPEPEPIPAPTPPPPPSTIIKVVAADENGYPLKDGEGNYLEANEMLEGGAVYYVALAFRPNTTVFNDATKLDTQAGTVDFIFTNATASGNDYTPQAGITGIELGTAVKADALDDYLSDNGETFNVAISNYIPPSPTQYAAVTISNANVVTTITDNPASIDEADTGIGNDDPTNGNYGEEDTVYAIIEGPASVNEGDTTTNYTVKLVDKDANPVTVTQDTDITITYTNDTTQNGDTEHNNNDTITVTITANSASNTFTVDTVDDPYKDDGEKYNLAITNVQNTGEFENVKIGDSNGDYKDVTTTINDDTTPATETDADTTKIVLVAVDDPSVVNSVNDLPVDANGVLTIDNDNITSEGGTFYYIPVAVDAEGKVLATQSGEVDLTYTDGTTTQGTDYGHTVTTTATIGTVFSVDALANDDTGEPTENFTVTISNPQNTPYESPQIDTDNDTVTSTINGRVYVKIINDDTQFEGHDLTHTVVLTDVHGNPITANVPAGETITVDLVFKNVTTADEDTNRYDNDTFQITIGEGEREHEITIGSFDDFVVEGDETYTIEIINVAQSNNSYESVEVIDAQKSVTGTIKDGVSLGTPENAAVDEDDFDITDSSSTITKTESLNITAPSGDNAYELLFDGAPTFSSDDGGYTELTSNGTIILYDTDTDGKIIGYLEGGNSTDDKVFEITLDKNNAGGGDDSYTYMQFKNIDHPTVDVDDDIVFTFGYKISDQGQISSVETFTVTVNDSLPSSENQNVNVDEDGSKVIVISDESFADGEIEINNNAGTISTLNTTDNTTIDIYDQQANDVVGTLTNNGDGTLTFTPTGDYSGETAGFSYSVSDGDGDTATATVGITVNPIADAPTMQANKTVTTWEDANTTDLDLSIPVRNDQTDQNDINGSETGDSPERLGAIEFTFNTSGDFGTAQFGYLDGNGDFVKLQDITKNSSFTVDVNDIANYHVVGTSGDYSLTQAQYQNIAIMHDEDNAKNIKTKISVASHEVDDSGNAFSPDIVSSKASQVVTLDVKAVTDDITALEFNSGDAKTHTVDITGASEGNAVIDVASLLKSQDLNDNDGSENRWYEISGELPEGSIVTVGGTKATVDSSGNATVNFPNDLEPNPTFTIEFPEHFSGSNLDYDVTITVKVQETDNDSSVTPEIKTDSVTLTIIGDITPVADLATLQIAQAFGYEDAGRSDGNTDAMDDTIDQPASGIALDIKVSSDDKDGSETFTVRISDIPNDAKIYYDGVEQIINSGEIIISNFNNDAPLYFIPPHNSDSDYTLKVNAQTVDGTSKWNGAWNTVTDKDMKVVVKDVADVPVGTELKDSNGYAYEAVENVLDDNGNSFNLKEVYQTPDNLNSYDRDSETLSIVLSSLPSGFGVEGASLIGNGVWTFLADNIDGVKITTPANFSGEASFDLKYVTTEDAGDSKTHHTDTVKIFVNPSAEAEVATATTANEDVLQKVDFGIVHKNGDTDETLEEIRIKVDDVEGKEFTLYIGNSTDTAISTLTPVGGYYVLNATQADNVYAKNTTEHTHGSYDFEVGYTVKDSETDKNTDDTKVGTITYNLTINAVTDAPTATIETINGGAGYSVNGTTVTVDTEDTTFSIPVKVTSDDSDGSEDVTQYLISGVPMGVEVTDATYYGYTGSPHNGIWLLDIADTAISDVNGYTYDIEFKVNIGADFENRDIKITAYTQDEGASVENDSVTFTLEKDYTASGSGTGTPPEFELGKKPATIYEDDDAYSLGESLTVTNIGGGASGNYAITITDLPVGSSVAGYSYAYEEGGVMRYVITGTGNAADAMTKLSNVTITPPANVNDSDNNTQSMTFTASIATHHSGTFHQGNEIEYAEYILPKTDDIAIAINTGITNEDEAHTFTVQLNKGVDDGTEIIDGKMYIRFTENYSDTGESATGSLKFGETVLNSTVSFNGKNYYEIDLPNGYTMGDPLTFTFIPGDNRQGSVEIEVAVTQKELHDWDGYSDEGEIITTKSSSITVNPVLDSEVDNVAITATATEDNTVDNKVNMVPIVIDLGSDDDSEDIISLILDKVPNGFTLYYGEDDTNLKLATNTGVSGSAVFEYINDGNAIDYNKWLIPTEDGLPAKLYLKAPEHYAGDLALDMKLYLKEINLPIEEVNKTVNVSITPEADGLSIDPTLTFGDAFDWVDLKLNANMEDVDGSEKMYLEIDGLDEIAQFRLSDGSSVDATYNSGKWTLEDVEYDQINNIQLLHSHSVETVTVNAWTVENANGDASAPKADATFKLSLNDISSTLALPSGAGLDFNKVDELSSLSAINTIDLGAQGANSLQNLTLADVVAITSNSNELVIDGDSADSVTFKAGDAGWEKGTSDGTYTTYTNTNDASVTLKIDEDIQQPIA